MDALCARPRRDMVRWDDSEWDQLAELVYSMRRKRPAESLIALANRAQAQFPKHRQRPSLATTAAIEPLVERIRRKDEAAHAAGETVTRLEDRLASIARQPTRDEVLASLSDEEIERFFGERVLSLYAPGDLVARFPIDEVLAAVGVAELAGAAAKRLVEELFARESNTTVALPPILLQHLLRSPNGHTNGEARPKPARQRTIAFLGLKPNQIQRVAEALRDRAHLHFVDKNRRGGDLLPQNVDYAFIWIAFTPHCYADACRKRLPAERIVNHRGGLTQLIARAEEICESQ